MALIDQNNHHISTRVAEHNTEYLYSIIAEHFIETKYGIEFEKQQVL
jgi:hypothetical protein